MRTTIPHLAPVALAIASIGSPSPPAAAAAPGVPRPPGPARRGVAAKKALPSAEDKRARSRSPEPVAGRAAPPCSTISARAPRSMRRSASPPRLLGRRRPPPGPARSGCGFANRLPPGYNRVGLRPRRLAPSRPALRRRTRFAFTVMDHPYDSVLLLAYGAPESMDEVRPFLDNILRGRPVPRERYEAVVHHYELIGGKSPLNELTARQARGLADWLGREGPALPVYVGMRFARPFVFTAIRDMVRDGRKRAVALILAPYRSEPSFEAYQRTVQEVLDAAGPEAAPRIDFVEPWFDHPLFAEAQADQVRRAFGAIPEAEGRRDVGPAPLHRAQHPHGPGGALPLRRADRDGLRERRPAPGGPPLEPRLAEPERRPADPLARARRQRRPGRPGRRGGSRCGPLPDRVHFRPRRSHV